MGVKVGRQWLIGELLSILERKESRLLTWGFLDGSFSVEEIVETFREAGGNLADQFEDWVSETGPELFVDNLAEAHLLVRANGRYRTRFAETVRLLARLRQRFSNDDWASAPNLVSDFKIHLSPRSYPKRDIAPDIAWEQIKEVSWDSSLQRRVFESLTTDESSRRLNLSGFQVRATERILEHYQNKAQGSGTVVSAGTGSGKTKAFYLPALMGIATDISHDSSPFTKVLAIYPRNILLADQLSEALDQAKRLQGILSRPITCGAYLGDTPYESDFSRPNAYSLENWKRRNQGWIPPFVKRANGGNLIWLDSDREAGRSTLRDADQHEHVCIPDGMLRLTRESIRKTPPDILMMSVEMLNREICSPSSAGMLGIKNEQPAPRLVLLDEVHTYEGTSGAQVPWILRRWIYWVRRGRGASGWPHFVGLSATLKEACSHLAVLTGVLETSVVEIKPEEGRDELESEGIEYNLVLKSHAGSGVSVLATSIQAVMLGARTLNSSNSLPMGEVLGQRAFSPHRFFGRKVFGFTDNLDSLNRWVSDLIDAERIKRLARFRASVGLQNLDERRREGQLWGMSEDIGHDLTQALQITRCSSQDPGIDSGSDVVLATSSLEVGYDDPNVGMIIHHKAPRSAASFLQRKGRAGRQRGVRPWTIVVLSDFGKDKWAFRDSERLFHPELDPLRIPSLNPYVVRIQATQFLIDWIGHRVGTGEPYRYLAGKDLNGAEAAKNVLNKILSSESARADFIRDLTYWIRGGAIGLRLPRPELLADSVLWNPPRAVLRHAIPELAKALAGQFKPLNAQGSIQQKRPLPNYIPAATFGELDAQDVDIKIVGSKESEIVDIAVALREAAPGRVSRRYVVNVRSNSLWHEQSDAVATNAPAIVSVNSLFDGSIAVGSFSGVEVFQPTQLTLCAVPNDVKDSSSSSWDWCYHVDFIGDGDLLGLADGPVLSKAFSSSRGYFHRRYERAAITRFATGFKFEVARDHDVRQRGIVLLGEVKDDETVAAQAIGYRRLVDAIRFRVSRESLFDTSGVTDVMLRSLRPSYLRYRMSNSLVLRQAASPFGIGALWSSSLAMLTATALLRTTTLENAALQIRDRASAARKVFECMLLGEVAADILDDVNIRTTGVTSRRVREVEELWQKVEVLDEVTKLERVLWEPPDDDFYAWLRLIYLETLGTALEQALCSIAPEIPEGELSVDVVPDDDGAEIVISEMSAGGVGHLERFIAEVTNAPERFDSAFEAALRLCENERISHALYRATHEAKRHDGILSILFEQVRQANSFSELEAGRVALIEGLSICGGAPDRSAVSALVAKVLRPGSSRETDIWIRSLARRRANAIRRLGIVMDQRVFAYCCVQIDSLERRMRSYLQRIGRQDPTPDQILSAFVQLIFQGCSDSCPECLGVRKEMEGIIPSRALAGVCMNLESIDLKIDIDMDENWAATLKHGLGSAGRIKLEFDASKSATVARHLSKLLAEEHDRGFLFAPFTVVGAVQNESRWQVTVQPYSG